MDDFYENVKTCIKAVILKLNQRFPLNSVVVRSYIVFHSFEMEESTAKYLKNPYSPVAEGGSRVSAKSGKSGKSGKSQGIHFTP